MLSTTSEISSAIIGTVNLYFLGKYAAAQRAIAASGAKFNNPIEPGWAKSPVGAPHAKAEKRRRRAGIIRKNLSVPRDMQRAFTPARLCETLQTHQCRTSHTEATQQITWRPPALC